MIRSDPRPVPRRLLFLRVFLLALGSLSAAITAATGQTRPFVQPLFTDHMVLQRDAVDPVWGWTAPGATVTVTVKDQNNAVAQTKTATAGPDGRWQVTVGPFGLVPNNAAYSLLIAGPNGQSVTVSDVLIGDVWICSGQSNMEYTLYGNYPEGSGGTRLANSTNEIADAAANSPLIRHFKASRGTVASTPQSTFVGGVDSGGWTITATNARAFTAVGYFMARQIQQSQGVPIGLLNLTWGSTDIAPWVAPETLRTIADFTPGVDSLPANPSPSASTPTAIFNAVVAPAVGFNVKGVAWLQGESSNGRTEQQYAALLAALRDGFRLKFNNANLPFIVPQICTDGNAQTVPVEDTANGSYEHFPEIRNAQLSTVLADANSRVVGTVDCGYVQTPSGSFTANVHPINKQTIGQRVGQAALNLAYGVSNAPLSPTFDHAAISGGTVRCYFNNVGPGLMTGTLPGGLSQNAAPSPSPVQPTTGATVTGFAIAGADKVFYHATAVLDTATNTVVLTSASVPAPVAVRFGWGTNPWNTSTNASSLNLYRMVTNAGGTVVDGVPVLPFRNDPVAQLSVNGGNGSGLFAPGAQTGLSASAAPGGQSFAFWTGDSALLANPAAAATTATLSKGYVSVRSIYQLNAAPAGLAATAGNLQAVLSWNALANAATYSVKRSTSSGGPFTPLATGLLTPAYTDNATGFGSPLFYKVSATNAAGESPDSAAVSVTPNPPATPAITGSAGNTVALLTWAAVPNATGYQVRRSTVSGGPYNVLVANNTPGTFYVDTGLANGTPAYYVVSALYNGSAGSASAEVAVTPSASASLVRRLNGTPSGATNPNTPAEGPASGFDANTATKWFGVQNPISPAAPAYLQYDFNGGLAWTVTQYQFATANDSQPRDPRDWLLQGSNDGYTWATLDTRTGQTLGATRRALTTTYDVLSPGAFRSYRLAVTATFGPNQLGTQLSEFLLLSAPTDAGDKTPPVLSTPGNFTVDATSAAGAAVFFTVTANDAVNGPLVPQCTPASGSTFPAGTTTVQCAATDNAGNSAAASFTVTVRGLLTPKDQMAPAFSFNQGNAQISLGSSVAGHTYGLQRSFTLQSGSWERIGALQNGGGALVFSDLPGSGEPRAFYRLVIDP